MKSAQEFETWFRAEVAAGRPPDALRRDAGTPEERFWARTVPGPDGHVFWDDRRDWQGRPVFVSGRIRSVLAQRFLWKLKRGYLTRREDVWTTCGEKHCLALDHLAAGWRARGALANVADSTLLEYLARCGKHLGHAPTIWEYDQWRSKAMHSAAGIRLRFGTWRGALKRAGFDVTIIVHADHATRFEERHAAETLLVSLAELARELGHPPSSIDWEKSGRKPAYSTIIRRFGSWQAARRAAGLE